MDQKDRNVFRIPPYQVGPQVFMYHEVEDRKPWSLVERAVPDHWARTMGEGVTVAILDTGLWEHRDLPSPMFAANFSGSKSVFDKVGHGTHVAGTVGARLDGAGVVGWAPKCDLGCVKVLGDDGTGTSSGIANGIRYAVEHGAHIINMSLGGGYDEDITQACLDAIQQGVFIICAAGNAGNIPGIDTIGWPGRLAETIAVASYRKDGSISDFSSRGEEVDVAFPGEDILSTWLDNQFRTISGTSMATPACSGLTALMLASHWQAAKEGRLKTPIRCNTELREHFKKSAQDMGEPGHDMAFGWGVPDVSKIITEENGTVPTPDPTPDPNGGDDTSGFTLFGRLRVEPLSHGGHTGFFVYTV